MYPQSKCTQAELCSLLNSLFNTQVLHYSVQLALNSPERIQSWTAVTWVQRVPESVCVAYKLYILLTVKEEQVYVPSGIRDALECIKRSHGLEEVVALRNLCILGTSGIRVKGQWLFRPYCNHCNQVGGCASSCSFCEYSFIFHCLHCSPSCFDPDSFLLAYLWLGLSWIGCISANKTFSSSKTSSRKPYTSSKQQERHKHSVEITIKLSGSKRQTVSAYWQQPRAVQPVRRDQSHISRKGERRWTQGKRTPT